LFVVGIPTVRPTAPMHRTIEQSSNSTTKLPQDGYSETPGMRHFSTKLMVVVYLD